MVGMLTDRLLAQAELPVLPGRLSQRRSSSRTVPTTPRSFSSLEEWPNFFQDARMLSNTLDDTAPNNLNVMDVFADAPLEPAADEVGVRVAIESVMFPRINKLAAKLNIPWKYVQGGSGRSLSYTDTVILSDEQQPSGNRRDLSSRIFGNGEVKGPWQWEMPKNVSYADCLIEKKKGQAMREVLQQLFGDMMLDETKYGFISNYNTTVFFKRTHLKSLQFSPAVTVDDAPLEKFLFVISLAYGDQLEKQALSRITLPDTPPQGYQIVVSQGEVTTRSGRLSSRPTVTVSACSSNNSSRKRPRTCTSIDFFQEHGSFKTLGITGKVIGFAKYGNVLEGELGRTKLALKTYDFRFEAAKATYLHEGKIYDTLHAIQGTSIPKLIVAGRIPHTSMYFLGLSDEGEPMQEKSLKGETGKVVSQEIADALEKIHAAGVLHNDFKLSHVVWRGKNTDVKIIDFDLSVVEADKHALEVETRCMKEILRMGEACE